MTSIYTECPNCQSALKSGIFNANALLDASKTKLINAVLEKDAPAYCNKCGDKLLSEARETIANQVERLKKAVLDSINYLPVISAQNPLNWDYEVVSMVTGQSVTGTGVFSEFFSSWTDLFGAQSGSYNNKLKGGEQLCFAQLRKQALDWGANAVIATDIDYSEVGGDKGMLMVCMAGTAVRVKNPEVLGESRSTKINELIEFNKRLVELQGLAKVG